MPKYAYRTPDGVNHGRFNGGYDFRAVRRDIEKEAKKHEWGAGEVVLISDEQTRTIRHPDEMVDK